MPEKSEKKRKICFELSRKEYTFRKALGGGKYIHVFTDNDGEKYAFIGKFLHNISERFYMEAEVSGERNKYGQIPIKSPKYVKHPEAMIIPQLHLKTIEENFDHWGDVAKMARNGFKYDKSKKYLEEIDVVASIAEKVSSSRPVAKFKAWLLKNGFEIIVLPLNRDGECRRMELKLHISGRIAVEGGNYQPRKITDKGEYVIYQRQRWYLPE